MPQLGPAEHGEQPPRIAADGAQVDRDLGAVHGSGQSRSGGQAGRIDE
jgi:hypothetical protein